MMVLREEKTIILDIRAKEIEMKIYHLKNTLMIKPYLRDLINNHKRTTESNNEENDRAEWKIQL